MGKRYSKEAKSEILAKIRGGQKVAEVAKVHGVCEMTVRTWLARDTEGAGSQILEMSRLRRENEALLRLVGQLTYESELGKKNQRRERH